MLDLVPRQIADVDETFYAVLRLRKHAEVRNVANDCLMNRADRIFLANVLPRVGSELLETERHLPVLAIDGKNLSLNLITYLNEFLCAVKPWRPAHLGNVDESFYAWLNLDECAVVLNEDDFTLNDVANLQVRIQAVPRMWSKLLVS